MTALSLPDWLTFPGADWATITPEEAGLDPAGFERWLAGLDVRGADFGGEDHTGNQYGAVLTRGGYLIHTWGDRFYRFQTASTGKAFIWALIGLAAAEGLLDPDEPINRSWTGHGQLSHPHKHLDEGHHRTLTWRHLIGPKEKSEHYGGFPIERGLDWADRVTWVGGERQTAPGVPEWSRWTGDPFYDNYAHTQPGRHGFYSSGGFWRLSQALTAVWHRDLKDVLDERVFSKIGIPADRWNWWTGDEVHTLKWFYPTIPDTYTYLDPPYEIDGNVVRSGPGWVIISASDLARFGLLLATQGIWRGERVMDQTWLRGHSGGNRSGVSGESRFFTAMAVVTTEGLPHLHATATESFIPANLFVGPVRVGATA
jgi:CubicO group peptidase (beta-lactamase class C family)